MIGAFATFAITFASLFFSFRAWSEEDMRASFLLIVAAALSFVVGAALGVKNADLRFMRKAMLALFGSVAAVLLNLRAFPDAGIASALYRSLLLIAPLVTLAFSVGGVLAYLFFGSGKFDSELAFERFVGWRYLRSLRGSVLSVVTVIALIGVILGVGLVIFGLSVLSGFEGDLVEKIIGAHAHLVVSKYPGYPVERSEVALIEKKSREMGALRSTPFVSAEIFIVSDSNHTEGVLYGVDAQTAPGVYLIFDKIIRGSLDKLSRLGTGTALLPPPTQAPERTRELLQDEEGEDRHLFPIKRYAEAGSAKRLPGIIIGSEMARWLHVDLDDTLTIVSPLVEELTPQGPKPKTKAFRVAAIFELRMYEFDAHYAYTGLAETQSFLEIGDDLSGVALSFEDASRADALAPQLLQAIGGYPFQAMSWQARNKNLFLALKLEKAVAFLVLIFIVLVASFSIVNTLTMTVIEKTREIAILKTMGGKDVMLARIFVVKGATIGVIGTVFGTLLGIGFSLAISKLSFAIDPDSYFLDHLPVRLHLVDIVQVAALAIVLTSLSSIFPAVNAAQLKPVDGLRYE